MAEADPGIKQVGIRELRANLSALLREAREGRSFQVVSRGAVVAQFGPPPAANKKLREFGTMKGQIWIADDFNETTEDIVDAMERW